MRGIVRPWGKALSMDPIDLQEDTKELEHLSTELEGLRYKNALLIVCLVSAPTETLLLMRGAGGALQ